MWSTIARIDFVLRLRRKTLMAVRMTDAQADNREAHAPLELALLYKDLSTEMNRKRDSKILWQALSLSEVLMR